ncbi:MAG: hypothetical protein R2769_09865 [Saprospiraceae bacterium]
MRFKIWIEAGCSALAAWNENSVDSNLILGRNFDFYVGDEFAKNKIILFMRPEEGILSEW